MTNIRSLPKIDGANTSFVVSNNEAWLDPMYFGAPGFGPAITVSGCSTMTGSSIVTVPTLIGTSLIQPGMQISPGPGLPSASYVGSVPSPTTFTVVDINNNSLVATATTTELTITFNPPPLDLSGIGFVANLRIAAGSTQVFLVAQTGNGTLTNGAKLGTLSFNVPRSVMQSVPPGSYVMDIIAADPLYVINLMANAPAKVTVMSGVADIATLTGTLHP